MLRLIGFIARSFLCVLIVVVAAHFLLPRAQAAEDKNANVWSLVTKTRTDALWMRYETRGRNVVIHLRDWQYDDDGLPLRLELFQLLATCDPGGVAPATVGVQRNTSFDPVSGALLGDLRSPVPEGVPSPVDVGNPVGVAVAMACAASDYANAGLAGSKP